MRLDVDPPLDPGAYAFSHRIRARFAETDAMGIVHHANHLLYLEEARVAYLRALERPYTELREEGVDHAVLGCSLRYRAPIRFDDLVDVHLVVATRTRATFTLAYLLRVGERACATAVTAHGAVDAGGRPVRLPRWLAEFPTASWALRS